MASSTMPLPSTSEHDLIEIAKNTLVPGRTRASNTLIPAGYLDELRQHVNLAKDDTFFRLYPHPGYGYGVVACLEQGCENTLIPLERRAGADSGMKDGIGSLSAYRHHIRNHPTHRLNSYRRVAKGITAGQNLQRDNRTISNVAGSHVSYTPQTVGVLTTANVNHSTPATLSSSSGKQSAIKRETDMINYDTSSAVPMKRPKLEPSPPAQMSNVVAQKASAGSAATGLTPVTARVLLEATRNSIVRTRVFLTQVQRKSRKSSYDRALVSELEAQLAKDQVTQDRCERVLRETAPAGSVSAPIPVKKEVHAVSVSIPVKKEEKSDLALPNFPSWPVKRPLGSDSLVPVLNPHVVPAKPNYGDIGDSDSDDDSDDFDHVQVPYFHPSAQDINKFIQNAGNAELFDGNESIDKALEKLGLAKLGEQLPMMTVPLMPHQVIGVAWMLEQEKGSNKGGILADEMGLGKTVQMIATIVQNRSDDPANKSTLICAPLALLDQWKQEIEIKTNGALTCFIHHGSKKARSVNELRKYDVILTTYTTLALEWPEDEEFLKRREKKARKKRSDDFIDSDEETKKLKKGVEGNLIKMRWWRCVLDEAQNIRNRTTRNSNAVAYINAKYKWCLTGTPVTNSLADCYAFFRFLSIRPWYEWKSYNERISMIERKQPNVASARLQALFKTCLLRRKKDSMLDGQKLIELPPKEVELHSLVFSPEEREIYDAIEKRSQAIFNKYLRAGTVLKNYTHVLVLLLRLRQLCSHPCLIQEGGDAFIRPEDDDGQKQIGTNELKRAAVLVGQVFVHAMKEKQKNIVLQRMATEKESKNAVIDEECPICFDTMNKPSLLRCGHGFCQECIENLFTQPVVEDGDERGHATTERLCPTCRQPFSKEMVFLRAAFEPADAELETLGISPAHMDVDEGFDNPLTHKLKQPNQANVMNSSSDSEQGPAPRRSGRRVKRRFTLPREDSDSDDMSDFIVQSEEDEEEKDARRELKRKLAKTKHIVLDSDEEESSGHDTQLLPPKVVKKKRGKTYERFLPSTKMKEMMRLLKEWAEAEETKYEKTIVLSQWTSCLDLIAHYLEENGFTFVRYQGNMSRHAREEAVRLFMSQGKARIMLMSLKCGGVGLNLTRANRVISTDLGWSPAVENQAFDRVHRLGQTRKVSVRRLVIENTVETRILALQERKQNLADGSLGEGTGKKLGRLSVKDLANLFGLNI